MPRPNQASDADLSIVFQGPILGRRGDPEAKRFTKTGLSSARNYFPRSELILSTWEEFGGEEFTEDLDFDELILNRDPGSCLRKDSPPTYHNVNRQIVSTSNGLRRASRPLAIKARSDVEFIHAKLLGFFGRYTLFDERYRVIEARACVSQRTTINPSRLFPLAYHVCDWFFFGLKSDLLDLFDIPLFPEPLYTRWYEHRPKPVNDFDPTNYCRYMPEDYLWSTFLKKHKNIAHEYYSHISSAIIGESERFLANNVVILPDAYLGIKSQKYSAYAAHHLLKCYTFREWERLYHLYSGGANPTARDWALMHNYVAHQLYRLMNPCIQVLKPVVKPVVVKLRILSATQRFRARSAIRS